MARTSLYRSIWVMILCASIGCAPATTRPILAPPDSKPRNVILVIVDGMGSGQLTGAVYLKKKDKIFSRFPVIGFQSNFATDDLITDSAASATAMSCGVKTYIGAIGVNVDTLPCDNIIEKVAPLNIATGLLVSSSIVHGTPAAFYAHQSSRLQLEDIAADMVRSGPDLFIGGGKYHFTARRDGRDLVKELRSNGYRIFDFFSDDFNVVHPDPNYKFGFFTAEREPLSATFGRDYMPLAVNKSVKYLKKRSDEGFFLMIEASQVDWACHNKNGDWLSDELRDLHSILYEAIRFAEKDGQTLIIVTGDHETGGVAVSGKTRLGGVKFDFATNDHTAEMIPVLALGPGSERFSGIYPNTEIHDRIIALFKEK